MCKGFLGITLGKNVDNIYSLDLFFNVIIIKWCNSLDRKSVV